MKFNCSCVRRYPEAAPKLKRYIKIASKVIAWANCPSCNGTGIVAYDREKQWAKFSDQVKKHIVDYTLVQYGNPEGNEQVDDFTPEDCYKNIMRYINRRNSAVRGNVEKLRDVIKIAHYCSFIYDKLKAELEEGDVY